MKNRHGIQNCLGINSLNFIIIGLIILIGFGCGSEDNADNSPSVVRSNMSSDDLAERTEYKTPVISDTWVDESATETDSLSGASRRGDLNGDGIIDLGDIILSLQIICGMNPSYVNRNGDVNRDGRVCLKETIFTLQIVSEIRQPDDTMTGSLLLSYYSDAPKECSAVYITIKEVQANFVSEGEDAESGWRAVASPNRTFNLLRLVNGGEEQLLIEELQPGEYTGVRLILGETPDNEIHPYANYVIDDTGSQYELEIPDGYDIGIKLTDNFVIHQNETTALVFDFDIYEISSGEWHLTPSFNVYPDADGDGIPDELDNCPEASNPDQTDTDEDGIGDACDDDIDGDAVLNDEDFCPDVSNSDQADADEDGIGDLCDDDIDGDSILNDNDNCPAVSNPDQTDTDDDGIGDACDADADGDGHDATASGGDDCNDSDPAIHPGADEICEDGTDQDCDGKDISCDIDGDAVLNDNDNCPATSNPDQTDTDTDGTGDACDADADGDGHDATASGGDDCNDTDAGIHPGAAEICGDGTDQDCDGKDISCDIDGDAVLNDNDNCPATSNPDQTDTDTDGTGDACDADADGDGHDATASGGDDCNDTDAGIHPAAEICGDGTDQDCDGSDVFCDSDGDGIPNSTDNCLDVSNSDQTDRDKDGIGDACDADADGDGYYSIASGGDDCNDSDPGIHPEADEICEDGTDQDCDGSDPICPDNTDNDGDGYTINNGDCNDTNPRIFPGATEKCEDGIDQDCDGSDLICIKGSLLMSHSGASASRYKAAYATIKEVQVHFISEGDEDSEWRVAVSPNKTFNLFELAKGGNERLFAEGVEIGKYTEVRLITGTAPDNGSHPYPHYIIDNDDNAHALEIQGGSATGIKLIPDDNFGIYENKTTEIVFDFDADEIGSSGQWRLDTIFRIVEILSP